jgi:hypothetical protein
MAGMLTLINTNRMVPSIGPIGLEYVGEAAARAGIEVCILDLGLSEEPEVSLREHFARHSPTLIGLTFRNIDDCFWPSGQWFVPDLAELVQRIRMLSDAPIVLGGVGFSIFPERIVEYTGADFGIHGDGEQATVSLYRQLQGGRDFEKVEGLVWRHNGELRSNEPAWPAELSVPVRREMVDNKTYFARGGQCGFETKRGCNRRCLYCADPLAKGPVPRSRKPAEIAGEIESLLAQGIDVLHTCDAEFNIPRRHALAVCEELIRRSLGWKVRWYAYLAVVPFDAELAAAMRNAGCVGINFTGDSASDLMLSTYRQPHRSKDLAAAVRLCRENGMKVMIDLLLGGPGETPQTVAETIHFLKQIDPDCVGASLGVRLCPGTDMVDTLTKREGPILANPGLRRKYAGPLDFFQPTFYISPALGPAPARLIKGLIAGDPRFFEPMAEQPGAEATDHNYNDNTELVEAIRRGARGAYWDILRQLRRA